MLIYLPNTKKSILRFMFFLTTVNHTSVLLKLIILSSDFSSDCIICSPFKINFTYDYRETLQIFLLHLKCYSWNKIWICSLHSIMSTAFSKCKCQDLVEKKKPESYSCLNLIPLLWHSKKPQASNILFFSPNNHKLVYITYLSGSLKVNYPTFLS